MGGVDEIVRRARVGGDELNVKGSSPLPSPEESESDEELPEDAFPASARVPGQAKSREIFRDVEEQLSEQPWYEEYQELRAQKLDWRKAAYVAWLATPKIGREPATIADLANLLGINDRTIRGWVQRQPELKELARQMQMAPLMAYRSDVVGALIAAASVPAPTHSADRRLFFQLTGDLEEKSQQRLVGSTEEPPIIILPAKEPGEPNDPPPLEGRDAGRLDEPSS